MTARSRLALVVGLTAVGAATFAAIGLWTAKEVRGPSPEVAATGVPWYDWVIDTPAPTPTRTPLSICIESATPANPALVYAALDEVEAKLERWAEEPRGRYDDATVTVGCPRTAGRGRVVNEPSGYQLFIRVLSSDEFHRRYGDKLYSEHEEEFTCIGHACGSVSSSIYVPSLEQKNLFEGIVNAFGLVNAMFYWTPTPQPYAPSS